MLLLAAAPFCGAEEPRTGRQFLDIRGQRQDLYCYLSLSDHKGRVLFVPGDGGWRGFAVTIAETISSWGYDVCGLDTKRYLSSFTSGRSILSEADVTTDLRTLAAWMRRQSQEKVIFVGWSEGADLGVLAAAQVASKSIYAGFVAIGLSESGVLGWRWSDGTTWITKREPDEPHFPTLPHLPKIAPLPLFVIHSSGDEYTPPATARKLFDSAAEPKRFALVQAQNHRFDGNRSDFFHALREGLEWVSTASR